MIPLQFLAVTRLPKKMVSVTIAETILTVSREGQSPMDLDAIYKYVRHDVNPKRAAHFDSDGKYGKLIRVLRMLGLTVLYAQHLERALRAIAVEYHEHSGECWWCKAKSGHGFCPTVIAKDALEKVRGPR